MAAESSPLLAASGLTFAYPRENSPVIEGLNACFDPASTTALTGPSGRGKSTLLYILGLMLKPNVGVIQYKGVVVNQHSDRDKAILRAKHFGFVFQDAALDPTRTVLDNIVETALYKGQPRRDAIAAAREIMEKFGVGFRANHKPGQISGGQAQRIALCRALLGNPSVVLADEPTGNLDPSTSTLVMEALKEHAKGGACIIIATHDMALAAACDRKISL